MTLVSGYLSMLEEGSLGVLPEQAARVVPLMTARMRHMGQLVDRMLTTKFAWSCASGTGTFAMWTSTRWRGRCPTSASSTAQGAHRTLAVRSPDHVHVRADSEQVEAILSNLVSNAVKYSPEGSEIHIDIREESGWAVVDVVDQGYRYPRRGSPQTLSTVWTPGERGQRRYRGDRSRAPPLAEPRCRERREHRGQIPTR